MAVNVRLLYGHYTDGKTVTATNTASGYSADSSIDLDRTTVWIAASGATINLTVDLGTNPGTTGLGIGNHNLATVIGEGATVTFRHSTDNFAASDDAIKTLVPTSDDDYYATFSSSTRRYLRIACTSVGATMPQIGEFYLGTVLTLTNNPEADNFDEGIDQHVIMSRAPSGRSVVKKAGRLTRSFLLGWNTITVSERNSLRTLFTTQDGAYKPFFYIPRDDSASPTEGQAFMVRLDPGSLAYPERFGGIFRSSLQFYEET